MAAARVFVSGGVSFDLLISLEHLPEPRPQTVMSRGARETVGGTGAGKALNLAKLGFETTLHTFLGADEPGRQARDFLTREGVHLLEDLDPRGTERHVNLMSADGGRVSIYVSYATHEPRFSLQRAEAAMAGADHLVLNLNNFCRQLIPVAQRLGKSIWTDLHDWDGQEDYHRDFARAADVVFLSSDRLADPRALMERLRAEGKQLVVCTHGRRGATALTAEGRWLEAPIVERFHAVDTNGAGDAFFAGYLFAHARGRNVERCLRAASIVAGLCVTSPELALLSLDPARVEAESLAEFGESS